MIIGVFVQIEGLPPPEEALKMPSQVVDADSLSAGGELEQQSDVSIPSCWIGIKGAVFQVLASLGQSLVRVLVEGQFVDMFSIQPPMVMQSARKGWPQ